MTYISSVYYRQKTGKQSQISISNIMNQSIFILIKIKMYVEHWLEDDSRSVEPVRSVTEQNTCTEGHYIKRKLWVA